MSEELRAILNDDGVFEEYDDTYDLTIHCENEKEQEEVFNRLNWRWIPVSERLPDYGVAVLTYDGSCYSVEKRIPTIRDDDGEPISGEWWVSDDYDESNSEYYPNLRDGACIAWMPLPEPYKAESEDKE